MPSLTAALVNRRASDIVLKYTVDTDLTKLEEDWLLSMFITGGEAGPIHQFGFRHEAGKVTAIFRFDHVAGMNSYSAADPVRVGDTWTVVFPAGDDVPAIGTFRAVLTVEGDEVSELSGSF